MARAENFEIGYGSAHSGDVFEDERTGLNLSRWCVRDEVLAKGREHVQQFETTPHEAHMRAKYLVAGTNQVVTVECLHIDGRVRSVVNAIQCDFSPGSMRHCSNGRDIDNGTER